MASRRYPSRRPPSTTGGTSDTQSDFDRMFADRLSAALPSIISQISATMQQNISGPGNGTGSGTAGPGAGAGSEPIVVEENQRGCTYKSFMACKPLEFKGTEGGIGILRWIEKTESVLDVSGCANNNKVKFSTCTFQGKALTWWNTEVRVRGREAISAITWEQLKEILITEYCPKSEIQKIEAELWELTMKGTDI